MQINGILSAKLPQQALDDVKGNKGNGQSGEHTHSGAGRNVLPKRQTGSFGFQHNSLPTTGGSNYYPISGIGGSGGGRYEPIRGNGLILGQNSNSLRGDRDRDYYPSSYPTSGRSSGVSGGLGLSYNGYRDDYNRDRLDNRDRLGDYRSRGGDRFGDYRDRDRQPYYDDYRYQSARDREAAAAQNMEFTMRNGQQRHSEYQKRIGHSGQEYYDPFYFIGLRNKQNGIGEGGGSGLVSGGGGGLTSFPPPPSMSSPSLSSGSSSSSGNGLLSPSSTSSTGPNSQNQNPPSSPSAPASHPLRNRRNSHSQHRHQHQEPNDYYDNEISGDKYELMSSKKNGYRHSGGRDGPPTSHHERWGPNHHLDQQFLTREQLVRQHPVSCHSHFC